jgi:AraC-like DNA-binding protein
LYFLCAAGKQAAVYPDKAACGNMEINRHRGGYGMPFERPSLFHEYEYRCTHPLHMEEVRHPALYELLYVHEGSGVSNVGDRTFPLAARNLLISDGTKRLGLRVDDRGGCVYTRMSIRPSALRKMKAPVNGIDLMLPFEVLGHHHMHMPDETGKEWEAVLLRVHRFCQSGDWVDLNRLVMAFFDLLVVVYALCEPDLKKYNYTVSDKERHVRKVMTYIENAFNEDVTLNDMERELHLSKQYMSRIFRKSTGVTIFDYLYRRRIEQAKQLFYMHRMCSVTDIGLQVGFKNMSHFSRMFKNRVGVTPEQYRRLMEHGAADDGRNGKSNTVK